MSHPHDGGIAPAGALALTQSRQIALKGRAAAHQIMIDSAGADMDYADELAAQILDEQFRPVLFLIPAQKSASTAAGPQRSKTKQ